MPLHLLGKKSWNVYNADNIARVRRDEAAAKAAEEAEEQRMQEIDAQRRIAILRGEAPPLIEDVEPPKDQELPGGSVPRVSGSMRRKRKRPDEDDTEFELRVAREKNELNVRTLEPERKATSTAPIVDHAGHIDLFGDEKARAHAEKNEEAEKEAKEKKKSFEDQYTMRLSNAAGKDGISSPWYSQSDPNTQQAPLKNVWGREDPQRRERDTKRIVANDPLAMMKQGASKVRELKKERKQSQEEQAVQLEQLRREERHREKRRRRHGEREGKRETDKSSRHSDHRHRSTDRTHHDRDQEESRSYRHRHATDDSRDRRRSRHGGRNDRDESRNDARSKGRREDDGRPRRRDSRSPARDDGERQPRDRRRD
ncbi:hypothetical protein B0J13DRAFT_539464 [Dactylonectria estremocensis]|uniref:CBF1-interacting co-repressor CIR N-terminal domain-containing protein n=1 Tax=Dactylonectria estremocensis TaxID=1079267 RepID=A0A9P9JFI3_9HYPO|nr:hypothetical protein B0J13DRAFT_539464 [Dactylonectria estremocensis]